MAAVFAMAGAVGLFPLLAGATTPTKKTFSNASIEGAWAWSYQGQLVRYPFSSIGRAIFDGRGGCEIVLKENSGANGLYDHTSTSCTYEVGKDGTGRAEFSLDGEAGAIDFTVGRRVVHFVSPDEGAVASGTMHRWSKAQIASVHGRWSFLLEGTILSERATGTGVLTLDGKGTCSQSLSYNYGSGRESVASTSCTYSVDENGFGSADVAYDNGTTGDFAFVTASRGRRALLLTAAEGEILLGVARRQ